MARLETIISYRFIFRILTMGCGRPYLQTETDHGWISPGYVLFPRSYWSRVMISFPLKVIFLVLNWTQDIFFGMKVGFKSILEIENPNSSEKNLRKNPFCRFVSQKLFATKLWSNICLPCVFLKQLTIQIRFPSMLKKVNNNARSHHTPFLDKKRTFWKKIQIVQKKIQFRWKKNPRKIHGWSWKCWHLKCLDFFHIFFFFLKK